LAIPRRTGGYASGRTIPAARVIPAASASQLKGAATARQLLREIDDIVSRRPALGTLIDEVRDFRDVLASPAAPKATGVLPLTPAELRLLPYLQTHLTADKIAERLFVSSHTVKAGLRAIYRKLGVSSRNDAVQRATAIGLLGG
jgi:LuxR family transcriptional regulator, maltose regulon positive regulatory protein